MRSTLLVIATIATILAPGIVLARPAHHSLNGGVAVMQAAPPFNGAKFFEDQSNRGSW